MKIYIVTEVMSRELPGNLLLGALLASRGHTAVILNQEDAFVLRSPSKSETTVFHAKSLHYSLERISQHRKLNAAGFIITSQDQETFFAHRDFASRVSERFCSENLGVASRVYLWSQDEFIEVSKQFPEHSAKLVVSGSPREDVWSHRFSTLAKKRSITRKTILIVPSVGAANNRLRHWELMALRKTVIGPSTSPRVFDVMVEDYVDGLRSQLFMSRVALKLADEFPHADVVIQPKKNEILESWEKTLTALDSSERSRKNIFIETDRFLEESIHGADVVINSNSTAGMMAFLGEIPLISIGPTYSLASEIGCQVEKEEEILKNVKRALQDPQEFIDDYRLRSLDLLGDRLNRPTSTLAAERIVTNLEGLDSSTSRRRLSLSDLLLQFEPGSIRRFLAGVKSLLAFRLPRKAEREMIETISQTRLDQMLSSISDALGVRPSIKATVLGRRNIIIRPKSVSS